LDRCPARQRSKALFCFRPTDANCETLGFGPTCWFLSFLFSSLGYKSFTRSQ
jgi:hypothetical protein